MYIINKALHLLAADAGAQPAAHTSHLTRGLMSPIRCAGRNGERQTEYETTSGIMFARDARFALLPLRLARG